MTAEKFKRKLTAILSADVKGYSRYMGREKGARAEAAEVLRIDPKFSLEVYARLSPFKTQRATDDYIEPLRKLGLK